MRLPQIFLARDPADPDAGALAVDVVDLDTPRDDQRLRFSILQARYEGGGAPVPWVVWHTITRGDARQLAIALHDFLGSRPPSTL